MIGDAHGLAKVNNFGIFRMGIVCRNEFKFLPFTKERYCRYRAAAGNRGSLSIGVLNGPARFLRAASLKNLQPSQLQQSKPS
jgi:hypothetical protein